MTQLHGPDLGTISAVDARAITAVLPRPWGADVRSISVIDVAVTTSSGESGHGFSWTPSIGAESVVALLQHDIQAFVIGKDADARTLWPKLWRHLHEAGSGGITTIAMAGVDLALWDLAASSRRQPLSAYLGTRRDSVKVYGSGVNLHYSLDELVAQTERWVEAGHDAVKVKVGKPDLREDVERIAAVRTVLGPDRRLMIDANQRWSLQNATDAIRELRQFGLAWIEEPLLSDDIAAHVELRQRIDVPVALGENLHTVYQFRDAIQRGACDIVQPNVIRVGGITPFLEIAGLAATTGTQLHPHLLPEISGQLALCLTNEVMVEDVEDASFDALGLLSSTPPISIEHGRLSSTRQPGLGLRFADRR